jgi:predicted kinase
MEIDEIASLRSEFKKTIAFPPHEVIPKRQFFLCPVGLVGAGKSTVVRPLSERLSLVRISSDELRRMLKEKGLGYESVPEIIAPLAAGIAGQGYSMAFDADCGNPKTKELIMKLAEKTGAEALWIHIDPPEEFIIGKLMSHKHTWLFKNGKEAVANYFEQKKRRQDENTQFNFFSRIDTSKDVPNQIDALEKAIRAAMNERDR